MPLRRATFADAHRIKSESGIRRRPVAAFLVRRACSLLPESRVEEDRELSYWPQASLLNDGASVRNGAPPQVAYARGVATEVTMTV